MTTIPKLFDIDKTTEWKKYLDEYGYVVIKNILSDKEKLESLEFCKKDLNHISPGLDWNNPETWTIDNSPLMFHKGMGIFNGIGQTDFMWSLRTNPNIKSIYKYLHNTEELCTSLDGFSLFLSNKQKTKSWLHIDQNPINPIYSIQGAYNFKKVGPNDAGFIVIPKSHRTFKPEVSHKRDWIQCKEPEFIKKSKKLLIPANCFTLWNSRLIHCNTGMGNTGMGNTNKDNKEFNRITCYITYLPKKYRTQKILEQRIEAYKNADTTSHWSNKCEIKRYPWGFGPRYITRGFNTIKPTLIDNKIPQDRLELL